MPGTPSTSPAARLALALALAGCGGPSADELLDTAHLEELQHNPTHARALYEDVIRRHPGTPRRNGPRPASGPWRRSTDVRHTGRQRSGPWSPDPDPRRT